MFHEERLAILNVIKQQQRHGFRIALGITALSLLLVAGADAGSASDRTYAAGDLILAPGRVHIYLENFGSSQECGDKNVTLLKEGYILSFDSAYLISIPAKDGNWGKVIRIANFSLYKNGEVAKKSNLTDGEFFYYNKTMDGREYTIIEFKVDGTYNTDGGICSGTLVQLRPFHQYSDGTGGQEIPADITGVPPSEEWNRTFGGKDGYEKMSVQQTGDGGYFLARSYSWTNWTEWSGDDIWLNRTDAGGNELWNKTLFEHNAQVYAIQQTADGGFIMTGIKNWDFYGYQDAKLIKLDPNGNEQWNKTFGGKYDDWAFSVRQTGDSGYILAGMTELYGHDAWLIKTDPNGSEQWNRTFYARGGSEALDVQQTQDGYIIAGRKISSDGHDALLIKTDSNGNERWRKTFGGERDDEVSYVRQTGDSGYILAGNTRSYGSGKKDAWLIKVSGESTGTAKAHTASPTETLAASPIPTLTAIPTGTAIPAVAGFEAALAITILLAVYIDVRKKMTTDVRMDTYITALVKKDGELVGKGIGTVCAFSSLLYAAAKCIDLRSEIEVVRE